MKRERRTRKQIKNDLIRNYCGMEAKVDAKAREAFKKKPYYLTIMQ